LHTLYKSVQTSYLVQSQKNSILTALDSYKVAFLSLVSEQQTLGYHDNDGLQKTMNESAEQVKAVQASLVRKTDQAVNDYVSQIKQITYILFTVALLISIFIGWALSHSIMSAILHIKNSIVRISETNDLTVKVSTKSNDELSDMAKAFNYMISNFQSLLVSVKKSEATSKKTTEILTENPLWADFIYEECLKDSDKRK